MTGCKVKVRRGQRCANRMAVVFSVVCALLSFSSVAIEHNCEAFRVGGYHDWKPVIYTETDTGDAAGLAKDLLTIVSNKLNIPHTFYNHFPWGETIEKVRRGELDILSGMYWTEKRTEHYLFTHSYLTDELRLYSRKNEPFIFNNYTDLRDKVGVALKGVSWGNEFDEFQLKHNYKVIRVQSAAEIFAMVIEGKADYFVMDRLEALFMFRKTIHRFSLAPKVFGLANVHFSMAKSSPCAKHIPAINRIIAQLKDSGQLRRRIHRYSSQVQ